MLVGMSYVSFYLEDSRYSASPVAENRNQAGLTMAGPAQGIDDKDSHKNISFTEEV